ncbi:cytochrome P450 [Nemania sp. FL0031]|nr:cytochrome P450 [Nemania sp. FL0031]
MFSLPVLARFYTVTHTEAQQGVFLVIALIAVTLVHATWNKYSRKQPPVINPPKLFDFTGMSNKVDFLQQSYKMIHDASRESSRPYSVHSDVGSIVLLPPKLVDEIKNDPNLSFLKNTEDDFHGSLPGFEPFKADLAVEILIQVAKKQLTKSLNKITRPLSQETAFAFQTILGDSTEWKEIGLVPMNLGLVCRLSSRVFLGEALCRNDDWLQITSEYPVNSHLAASKLRLYPKFSRPLVHWFLPECRLLRRQYARARSIIEPIIRQRQQEKRAALAEGRPVPKYDDAIDWADDESKQFKYEPATLQLGLAGAAVHTTTDLLSKVILELLAQPELISALRTEIIEVLRVHGWTKVGLYNLKLMDSVLKETQRVKPIQMITMKRFAEADIRLSDGTVIPKGAKCAVTNTTRLDANLYENPDHFDGYRFLKMRNDPGKENSAQFVATSVESLGFGHGVHACPGRFFAANEVKVTLCHLLLKYDLELSQAESSQVTWYGFALNVNQEVMIRLRRRKEEIDIDSL